MSKEVQIVKRKIPPVTKESRGKWVDAISKLRPGTEDSFSVEYGRLPAIYAAARRIKAKLITRRLDFENIAVWRRS